MNDAFYLELRKANNEVNAILNGNNIEEKIRIISLIEDCIDMLQTISIIVTQDTFLDAEIKLGEYESNPGHKDFSMLFDMYIEQVEIKSIRGAEEIDDARLMDLFLFKCISSEREPALQLSLLIFIMGFMSIKNKETLLFRHERMMSMIPDQITYDYLKNKRFSALKDFEIERISDRIMSLSYGSEISLSGDDEGFSLVRFVDETIEEMTKGESQKLIKLLSEDDLVNTMDVISGESRKKLFDNMEYEYAAWISNKIMIFAVISDAQESSIFSKSEVDGDLNNRILPSVRRAIETMITISGKRLKFKRRDDNERDQKRVTGTC